MTINPHKTDQLLAEFTAANPHEFCGNDCELGTQAKGIVSGLLAQLPGVDPELMGEIVLHTGFKVAAMRMHLERTMPLFPHTAAALTNAVIETGSLLLGMKDETRAAVERPTVEDVGDVVDVLGAAMVKSRGRASLSIGYGLKNNGAGVFTVLLFDNGPESFDVMGRMPGDGQTTVLAHGQASTLAEALILCAVSTAGA